MGCTERALGEQLESGGPAGGTVDAHHFDRLRALERRQDRRQALGEHRLAGSRRTAQQAVVRARGGHCHCLDGLAPATHVSELEPCSASAGELRPAGLRRQGVGSAAAEHPCRAREPLDDADPQAVYQHRLACACRPKHEHVKAGLSARLRDGERAVARTHLTVERELAEECACLQQLARYLPACREHPAGKREIESGPDLGHIGGGEVSRDASRRELVAGVEHGRMHTVARLAHGRIG
jgi:hypothetical protein